MNDIFVDSNIILYSIDEDDELKKGIARKILSINPKISGQVLTEVANVCKHRFSYKKDQLLVLWSSLLEDLA